MRENNPLPNSSPFNYNNRLLTFCPMVAASHALVSHVRKIAKMLDFCCNMGDNKDRQALSCRLGTKMIEAVKSTVANSALLRANAGQSSSLSSFAANPDKIQSVSQPPYVSPTVRVDVNTKIAILEFRESLTGEVLAQIPSEQALRSYRAREAKEDVEIATKLLQKTNTQNGDQAAPTQRVSAESVAPQAPAPAPEQVSSDASLTTTFIA